MPVNQPKIISGVKTLVKTIFLMVLGPLLLNQALKNQQHPLFYPVLGAGILAFFGAIYMGFKGILTVVKGIFNDWYSSYPNKKTRLDCSGRVFLWTTSWDSRSIFKKKGPYNVRAFVKKGSDLLSHLV